MRLAALGVGEMKCCVGVLIVGIVWARHEPPTSNEGSLTVVLHRLPCPLCGEGNALVRRLQNTLSYPPSLSSQGSRGGL